jgi:hypothetical protein
LQSVEAPLHQDVRQVGIRAVFGDPGDVGEEVVLGIAVEVDALELGGCQVAQQLEQIVLVFEREPKTAAGERGVSASFIEWRPSGS